MSPSEPTARLPTWLPPLGAGLLFLTAAAVTLLAPRRASAAALSRYYRGPVVASGGSVMSRFGHRTVRGERGYHYGIDLQARRGTPVRAAGAGVVRAVYPDREVDGYGNLVVIQHGDGEGTLYSHLDAIDAAMVVGAAVAAGQQVGTVGCTDSTAEGFPCSGAHLHFEVMTPPAGDERAFAHFTGSTPTRIDPQAWAAERGIALV
jgi:murein DD-endopeptidase MepM/ murein hydrolase activator NlpD